MKKVIIFPLVVCLVVLGVIYLNFSLLNPYNTVFFHPFFSALLPITILLFVVSFLKNTKTKNFFLTLGIFAVLDFLLLSKIDPLCSAIVCYDRTQSALIISSTFSFVYLVILLIQNRKK